MPKKSNTEKVDIDKSELDMKNAHVIAYDILMNFQNYNGDYIEDEINIILETTWNETYKLMSANWHHVENISRLLIEKKTVYQNEFGNFGN